MIEGFTALYIFMLSAFTGYEVISRVPAGNAVGGFVVTERMLEMFKSEKEKG
jgi:NAD(P) transhydrogenase subunit alpha